MKAQQLIQSPRFYLFLLSALIILVRCLTFYEPYERDLMIYAVTARELLSGRALYSDVWDIKPPGIYLIYAFSQMVAGYTRGSIFLLGITSAIVTLIGVYRVVSLITGQVVAALWAAFFWFALCSDILLQANQPNTEVFLNAFFVWAVFFFVRAYPGLQPEGASPHPQNQRRVLQNLFIAGSLWASASLIKQVSLTVPFLLLVYILIAPDADNLFKHKIKRLFVFGSPILLLWAFVSAYFYLTGRWGIFYFTMVDYGKHYAAVSSQSTSQLSWLKKVLPTQVAAMIPAVFLCVAALVLARPRMSGIWVVLGLCALAIALAVAVPGNYFPHYYQLWLPLLCILVGVSIGYWQQKQRNGSVAIKLAFLMALLTLSFQWVQWGLTPEETSIAKYSSDSFVRLPGTAKRVANLLLPNENFYQFGFDPGFYFETKRHPLIGIIVAAAPQVPQPQFLQDRLIAELSQKKPEVAVIDLLIPPSRVTDYLYQHYVPVPHFSQPKDMIVMARRGSNLLRRREGMATDKSS